MADTVLGTLTIGQAPRPDVTPILDRYVPTSVLGSIRATLNCTELPSESRVTSTATRGGRLQHRTAVVHWRIRRAFTASGVSLVRRGAEALLLDCIGFVEAHRRQLAHASGLPVILSNALMAKIVGEMVAG